MDECKILIIDDDEDDVEILVDAFAQCGIDEVHCVFTAMQALMYLQNISVDRLPKMILTDHFLPGINGVEFLHNLKRMEKYKNIPVIVLSNIKSESQIEKYREMGVLDYLPKPESYEDFVKIAAEIKARLKDD